MQTIKCTVYEDDGTTTEETIFVTKIPRTCNREEFDKLLEEAFMEHLERLPRFTSDDDDE